MRNELLFTGRTFEEQIQHDLEKRTKEVNHFAEDCNSFFPADKGKFTLNEAERTILSEYYEGIVTAGIKPFIRSSRLGDGTINIEYKGCQVGRINLQTKQQSMSFFTKRSHKQIDGDLADFLQQTHHWIVYTQKLEKEI